MAKKPPKACPQLRFETVDGKDGLGRYLQISASTEGSDEPMGMILARSAPYVHVASAQVYDHKRCGVGTQLYERMAALVCATFKTPLASSDERSKYSQGFWAKQVRKGRARCAAPKKPDVDGDNYGFGPSKPHDDDSIYGRGDCDHYVLKSCDIKTLSGRRR